MKPEIKYQIVLRGLNGILKSRPMDVEREWAGGPIYFGHVNKSNFRILNWKDLPESDIQLKKLKFEFTGRVFWKKKTTAIYEYELTEI
jgi:hypothetical protein